MSFSFSSLVLDREFMGGWKWLVSVTNSFCIIYEPFLFFSRFFVFEIWELRSHESASYQIMHCEEFIGRAFRLEHELQSHHIIHGCVEREVKKTILVLQDEGKIWFFLYGSDMSFWRDWYEFGLGLAWVYPEFTLMSLLWGLGGNDMITLRYIAWHW